MTCLATAYVLLKPSSGWFILTRAVVSVFLRRPGLATPFFLSIFCNSNIISQSQWSKFYSPGTEIQANIERVVDKYKLREYIHLRHELTFAQWNQTSGKWTIRIRHIMDDAQDSEEFEETCDILLLCVGSLHRWQWPNIPGLKNFGGTLVHSAEWDADEKLIDGKRVGVVGNVSLILRLILLS